MSCGFTIGKTSEWFYVKLTTLGYYNHKDSPMKNGVFIQAVYCDAGYGRG